MTNLFAPKKAPDPLPPVTEAETVGRSDPERRKRLSTGGTYATLFGQSAPIGPAVPKSTLFGG